jgi:L-rhamnose mutarotase
MQSFGLTLLLQDDSEKVRYYKELHQHVWPAVAARLRGAGIGQMEIFLAGRRLFMYLVTDDDFAPSVAFPRLDEDPEYRRWSELTRSLQERAPEATEGEWWSAMEKVFDLKRPQRRPKGS